MIQLTLPPYQIRVKETHGRKQIFDILRRKYVALTPEEWVRQHFIHYLVEHKNYPSSLLANEVPLQIGEKRMRADSVLYDNQLHPRMIIEYKAPNITLTQKVFDQITVYNLLLHVDYLIVSNGMATYICKMDYEKQTYKFLEENRKIPQMRIVCKGEPKPIKFILDSHIKTRLKINQTSEMFLWDTGSEGALLIPHRYADALGLDYRNKSVNSKDAQDPLIIVDSLIIGNFTLYNVPAFIHDMVNPIPALYDRRASEKELHDALMVYEASNIPIIGLPVIKHLEKLGIDWKNNCFFFPKKTLPAPTLQEQMFVTGVKYSKLITPFSINSVRALAMIDIGSTTFADMHKNLVNAYPKRFSTIKDVNAHSYSLTLYGVSDTTNVFLVKPSLTYANQLLLPKERLKVIGYRDEDQDMKSWDVQLGYPFFKSLGEVMVLDFKEMKLKIWRKSDAIHLH